MAYTDIDKPSDYFNTKLYTGNGSSGHAITGVGFQPDWIWIKDRGAANWHSVRDSVRGTSRQLFTNEARAEETASYVTAFNSDGFTLGTGNTDVNANNNTYASWNWRAGTSFTNDASATGIGTIDSTGSVNTDAGFSIISYTGNASASQSVAHGLGVAPSMIIVKKRSATGGWVSWHKSLSGGSGGYIYLNGTGAAGTTSGYWGSAVPSSTTFGVWSVGGDNNENGSTFIAYCFAEKQGYSKFGSYVGNANADGTFVYTGFRSAFLLCKRADGGTGNWHLFDNKRLGYNLNNYGVQPNLSNAENTAQDLDILSNGFKHRQSGNDLNGSNTYIYMAFAENPFVTSTGVPATAR